MSSQRASAREAMATIGHALAGQSQPIMFVGGTVTALYPLDAVPAHFEGDLTGQARADLVLAWLTSLRRE